VMISMMQADKKNNKKETLEILQCKPERPTTATVGSTNRQDHKQTSSFTLTIARNAAINDVHRQQRPGHGSATHVPGHYRSRSRQPSEATRSVYLDYAYHA
jgi:hypothetical protein